MEHIIKLGTAISQLEDRDLAPGPIANALFSGLVHIVREFPPFDVSQILLDPTVQFLQPLVVEKCSVAEYLLEVEFARRVILYGVKLSDFMYYENYQLLVEFEMKCLAEYIFPLKIVDEIAEIVIVGSGPLPLTSIVVLQHLHQSAQIVNYDHNEEANVMGAGIVASYGLENRVNFVQCTALNIETLHNADVVYMAALVGNNAQEKREIISHLYKIMKPGAILAARCSTGLREFIYQPISQEDFGDFEQFQQYDPDNEVIINSIALGRKFLDH